VLEDPPVAEARLERGAGSVERVLQRLVPAVDGLPECAQILARLGDRLGAGRRPASGHDPLRTELLDAVERRRRPLLDERVAHVRRGARLDEVAGEEHALLRQPHSGVALCVPAPEVEQLHLPPAEVEPQRVREGHVRIRQAGDRVDIREEPREPARLRLEVGLATLEDPAARPLVRDDPVRLERRGAEHADGVVVREHEVADGLVCEPTQLVEPLARMRRRRACVDGEHGLFADHRPDVGVALRGERHDAGREFLERRALLLDVGTGRERLRHPRHGLSTPSGPEIVAPICCSAPSRSAVPHHSTARSCEKRTR
jgi:hypothetical protein